MTYFEFIPAYSDSFAQMFRPIRIVQNQQYIFSFWGGEKSYLKVGFRKPVYVELLACYLTVDLANILSTAVVIDGNAPVRDL